MTTLVTGSAGHLGEALMRTLRESGERAVGLDVRPSPFTSLVGSIGDRTILAGVMASVRTVIHTATLHKPHLATHSTDEFVATNVHGTRVLLEEAVAAGVEAFVFTSSTSVFGKALAPMPGEPAVWVTEDTVPIPKNIYGTSKLEAERLCEVFHQRHGLPVVILRTARFFPEADDDPEKRASFSTDNMQVLELLHRRADIEDVVSAHLAASVRAREIGFDRFVVSATTPFQPDDLARLRTHCAGIILRMYPHAASVFQAHGWRLAETIDRVYVNARARTRLDWTPTYDFSRAVSLLEQGEDHRSNLARIIGVKGYHSGRYTDGLYPVQDAVRDPAVH